jgi:hypothetical protein
VVEPGEAMDPNQHEPGTHGATEEDGPPTTPSPTVPTLADEDVAKSLVPAGQTLLFLVVAGLAFWLLSIGATDATADPLVGTKEWTVWRAVAAIGQAAAVSVGIAGVLALRRLTRAGLVSDRMVWAQVGVAFLFAGLLTFLMLGLVGNPRTWPVPDMDTRLGALVVVATICALPWVALVWLGHRMVRAAQGGTTTEGQLLATWNLINSCALSFAIFVVVALLPAGGLRNLWLANSTTDKEREVRAEEFPTSDVLLYGATYGLIALVVVVPLVFAWRSAARDFVNHEFPPQAHMSKDDAEARVRLESLLGLDVTLIRNPLTLLTVLTPLVTSLLAAFLPELGG